MQIRATSELDGLSTEYKNAFQMPDSINHDGIYIEVSYKNGTNYESMKVDLCSLIQNIYTGMCELSTRIKQVSALVDEDNRALSSSSSTKIGGIFGYGKLINDVIAKINSDNNALSSSGTSQGINGFNKVANDLSAAISANYLSKTSTGNMTIAGNVTFSKTIIGTCQNALTAECAKWN